MTRSSAATGATIALVVLMLTGCASTGDPNDKSEPMPEREYKTGSMIPVRGARAPTTEEERQRIQQEVQAMRDAGMATKPRKD